MSAIAGEYTSFKHVKTRKAVVLEIEIPEEAFQNAIAVLGMPVGGKSHPVAIALLDSEVMKEKTKRTFNELPLPQQAVLMCKDMRFWSYINSCGFHCSNEEQARGFLCEECKVSSRAQIVANSYASVVFGNMKEDFSAWKTENDYKDNLERV